jgi:thiamine-phosphate pyrophosphorylase
MKCDENAMLLYAVTDRAWVGRQSLHEQVECALKGGATCMQLREKKLATPNFYRKRLP